MIENELYRRARLRDRWCLERGYASMHDSLSVLTSTSSPLFPRHSIACDHRRPIRLHKLHGSLNWIFRLRSRLPTARQLTGLSQPPELFLTPRREIASRLRYTSGRRGRGRTTWQTWPLIIPPIYSKGSLIQVVQPAWADARSALERADRVVFFGYSMPPADIEAEKLFQRAINANDELDAVDVINPDPGSAATFARLAPKMPLRWYPSTDAFLQLDRFVA